MGVCGHAGGATELVSSRHKQPLNCARAKIHRQPTSHARPARDKPHAGWNMQDLGSGWGKAEERGERKCTPSNTGRGRPRAGRRKEFEGFAGGGKRGGCERRPCDGCARTGDGSEDPVSRRRRTLMVEFDTGNSYTYRPAGSVVCAAPPGVCLSKQRRRAGESERANERESGSRSSDSLCLFE